MRRAMLCLLALALCACAGTSAGNPFMGGGDTSNTEQGGGTGAGAGGGQCDATPTTLGSVAEKSPLGFSAADVLSFAGSTHDTSIRWQPSEFVSYGPESGTHRLSLTVTPKPGAKPRYVTYSQHASSGGAENQVAIAGPSCESLNAVEIDVTAKIKSDGGALDEQIDGVLRASSDQWATLHLQVPAGMLGGAFEIVSSKPPGFELSQVAIDLGFSPLGLRGSLMPTLEMHASGAGGSASTDSAVAAGGAVLALIGAEGCDDGGLPIALDAASQGFSGQDAVDLVNSVQTAGATWQDGTSADVSVSFEPGGGPVCALLDANVFQIDLNVPGTLRLHGTLQMSTADGKLDARWPVTLDAAPDESGALSQVSIALDAGAIEPASADNLESLYGVHGVDAGSYDSLQVSLELAVMAGASAPSASGMLQVSGLTLPDCAKNPAPAPEPTPGMSGGSAPGCAGADFTPLLSLSF